VPRTALAVALCLAHRSEAGQQDVVIDQRLESGAALLEALIVIAGNLSYLEGVRSELAQWRVKVAGNSRSRTATISASTSIA
jgi:hypothetical protein